MTFTSGAPGLNHSNGKSQSRINSDCLSQSSANRIKTLHVINDLSIGGAEMMLYKLLSAINRTRFDPVVISLMNRGELRSRIEALDIPVYTVGMKPGVPTPVSIWRLIRLVRRLAPDLIQGWLPHANLAAQLTSMFAPGQVSVLWKISHTPYPLDTEKPVTATAIKLCAQLSNLPAKILNNSRTSAAQHKAIGYPSDKTLVIPNGFDTNLFIPSTEAHRSLRAELGVAEGSLLIGLIGRFHPMKDHANFLRAARLLLRVYPGVQFVLSGKDINWKNSALCKLIYDLAIVERVHLLDERDDMPRLTAALDIAASSSYSEGFPNAIGEAMACGVPCVVTDVGDSAWMVGESGRVVPVRNSEALADAWRGLIELGPESRAALGRAARARVLEHFSLRSVVAQYETLYENVMAQKASGRAEQNGHYHRLDRFAPANDRRQEASSTADVGRSAPSEP
ncbi:MAG: glycosyltransferase [Pyrinomonadaceae bacterium]|nr:glycosyltransferase [Pyrinomonadaceae bacterium]